MPCFWLCMDVRSLQCMVQGRFCSCLQGMVELHTRPQGETNVEKAAEDSEDIGTLPWGRHSTRHFYTRFSRPSLIRPSLFVTFSKGAAGAGRDSWAVRSMQYQIKDQCLFFQACRGCDAPLALFFAQLFHSSLHRHHHHHSLVSVMVLFTFTSLTFRHSFQVLLTIHFFLLMTMKFTLPYF